MFQIWYIIAVLAACFFVTRVIVESVVRRFGFKTALVASGCYILEAAIWPVMAAIYLYAGFTKCFEAECEHLDIMDAFFYPDKYFSPAVEWVEGDEPEFDEEP